MNEQTRPPDPLTRIDDARREVGETDVSPAIAAVLSGLFIVMVGLPSLLQRVPRAGGDEPVELLAGLAVAWCSPRGRG